jgi:hypothetical protein
MFTRLAKFRLVQSRRAAPGPRQAFTHSQTLTHSNDNLPGFRRPEGRRRIPTPALACHWLKRNGRLECRWQLETSDDAPLADADTNAARQAACQGGISHNGLRTVLSGTRRLERRGALFALGHRQARQKQQRQKIEQDLLP